MLQNEAAGALERGDPLRALNLIGRELSAIGSLLRGIAYAQLGDYDLAAKALADAVKLGNPLVRARARAASVEIALRTSEPGVAAETARASIAELTALGDLRNAALQRLVFARVEILRGRLAEARALLEEQFPSDLQGVMWLARAEVAVRSLAAREAQAAIDRARVGHALLERELDALQRELSTPIVRIVRAGQVRDADLFAIEDVAKGDLLLVDACRMIASAGRATIPLARRPVLFALLATLARAWPEPVPRDVLAQRAFDVRRINDSHRSRLRVEIGRLRSAIVDLGANPEASKDGYVLRSKREVASLAPRSEDDGARVALLLGDGAAWSAQSLAEHACVSKRTAQRALAALVEHGNAVRIGAGRDVRYMRPGTPLASRMLLLGLLPKS